MVIAANKLELLQIADAVAREKSIDRMIVIEAIEEALSKAARGRYGLESDIRVEIDPRTGEQRVDRFFEVVDDVENDAVQISLKDAQVRNPAAEVGDMISDRLPPVDPGRVATQAAKQVLFSKVREAERDKQFEEYKDRVGEIIHGEVKRADYGDVVVDLPHGEGIIKRSEGIPREMFRPGDRVRALILDVRREIRGPQIFLSRSHPDFMAKLFMQEVPEIYEGIIEVKRVARDPGSRAKIGVLSHDGSIDPVGACVGMRGSRVQAVVQELSGEKIDIIPFTEDDASFIVNALQPAEVAKVVLDDDARRIEVVVPDDQLSLAIGRRGQNVRLASQLSGWDIDILTEEEESARRQKEFAERTELFQTALDVDEVVAQLLASEGFTSLDEVAYVEHEEIAAIQGFDDEVATELQTRAQEYLDAQEAKFEARRLELGVSDDLRQIEGLTTEMLVVLGEDGVQSMEDFAGSATDELAGWSERNGKEVTKHDGTLTRFGVGRDDAEAMIMQARVLAGWIDPADLEPEAEEEEEPALA